ncbi:hypothetical protein P4C99_21270 [Pontiellaceae bacterium B1224]|nr:hypothetical protein [Pontiellaceae bacterium B1224]
MKFKLILLSILTVFVGTFFVWFLLGRPATGIDDADIFFVYACNFSAGHGFVYNIGGETVEGFTSLLWTVICSGAAVLFQTLETPLLLLNVLLGAVAVGACLKRSERPRLFILMLAAMPAWFAWCQLTLMDAGLWCLIITLLGWAVVERRRGAVLMLLPLMLITRPESMLWGAWVIVLVFVRGEPERRIKTALPVLLVYLFTLAALIGFRMHYFGYPVPNTYYAKVSPGFFANIADGTGYLLRYAISGGMVLVLLIILLSVLLRPSNHLKKSFWLALFLLPGLGIPVLVGGDHFGSFRFYQPLWPLLCWIGAAEWPQTTTKLSPKVQTLALIGLLLAGWILFPMTGYIKHEFRIAGEGRANGAALLQMFQDLENRPTVGVITAGGNKLGYPGRVFDLMGLNSTEMAHAPGDAANFKNHTGFTRSVFYRWQPDIVLCGDSEEFDLLVLNGLFEEPQFNALYEKCTLLRNGAELTAWFNRDFMTQLPDAAVQDVGP